MIQENNKDIRCAYCGLILTLNTDNLWFDTNNNIICISDPNRYRHGLHYPKGVIDALPA